MNTLERTIITALLRDMREEGYQATAVWTGEDYVLAADADSNRLLNVYQDDALLECGIARPLTDAEVFQVFADYDMHAPTLHFTHKGKKTWGNRGVMLVEGNGEDIISDYHVADGESFGSVVDHLYDQLNAGAPL